jgi:hypothetical protein
MTEKAKEELPKQCAAYKQVCTTCVSVLCRQFIAASKLYGVKSLDK